MWESYVLVANEQVILISQDRPLHPTLAQLKISEIILKGHKTQHTVKNIECQKLLTNT